MPVFQRNDTIEWSAPQAQHLLLDNSNARAMIVYANTPPPGDFERFGFPMTLGEVALMLVQDRDLCLRGCSRPDMAMLQLVSEPYGYDMTFVAALPACSTGDVYFTRKTTSTTAIRFAFAINGSAILQDSFRRMT